MKIAQDILELFRAILTILIFVGAVLLTGIFSIPFLGTKSQSHQMIVENGITSFLFTRFLVLATVNSIAFSLLYFIGWLCKKKTSKKTYVIVFMSCLAISIWLALELLNDCLWNYVPID